ncbi:MAG: PEP-CTERM sorting domain-containing protein [Planctomycetota bacterium]|jgi:hypothetical protein
MPISLFFEKPVVTTVVLPHFCGNIVSEDLEDGKMMRKFPRYPPIQKNDAHTLSNIWKDNFIGGQKMKKVLMLLIVVSVSAISLAGTDIWKGGTWTEYIEGIATVNGSDHLVVTTTATPGLTRLLTGGTDYFQITVDLDQGPQSTVMLGDYTSNLGAQIAVNFSAGQIGREDFDTGAVNWIWDNVSMPTDGIHTLAFTKATGGLVSIDLDGSWLWTAPVNFEIDTIEQALAGAMNGTGYFTDYSLVPEPATMLLLGLGGLLIRKRK